MLEIKNLSKTYQYSDVKAEVLHDISITVEKGDFIAVMGASGSGKSTLLNIIGCMDYATGGTYFFDGIDLVSCSQAIRNRVRKEKITFVFQNFALMEKYTAFENIELSLLNRGISRKERRKKIISAAEKLGIADQLYKFPKRMSGGQQQRIALARALVSEADVLLADEPTGALDRENGMELMHTLKGLNDEGKTIIVVTHDDHVAEWAKKTIIISDGRILR